MTEQQPPMQAEKGDTPNAPPPSQNRGLSARWLRIVGVACLALAVVALAVAGLSARSLVPASQRSSAAEPSPTIPVIGDLSAQQPGDWPMYGHDLSRTNYNADETAISKANAGNLTSVWQAGIGFGTSPPSGAPSVSNGTVYVGSSVLTGPNFFAFDATTGAQQWNSTLGNAATCFGVGIGATSAIADGVVVEGGSDGAYYGLDAQTGLVLWRHPLNEGPSGYPWASPLIYNGRAYIGVASGCDNPSVRGEVRALDLHTGSVLASVSFVPQDKAGAGIWNSPALTPDGGTLVVATGEDYEGYNGPYNRAIVTLDPLTLNIRAAHQQGQRDVDADFGSTPVVFHDSSGRTLVAALHKDDNFYVYDMNNLSAGPLWSLHTGAIIGMTPAYDPTYGDGGTLFYMDGLGTLHAADPDTGADRWQPAPVGSCRGNMAIANGLIYLNAGASGVIVIDESTGYMVNKLVPENPGKSYSGVVVSHGFVYWLSGSYLNAWSLPQS